MSPFPFVFAAAAALGMAAPPQSEVRCPATGVEVVDGGRLPPREAGVAVALRSPPAPNLFLLPRSIKRASDIPIGREGAGVGVNCGKAV